MGLDTKNICTQCRFCCDGTLFAKATLDDDETIHSDFLFKIIIKDRLGQLISGFQKPKPLRKNKPFRQTVCQIQNNGRITGKICAAYPRH